MSQVLFVPGDIMEANEEWGANCGPCSLAAVIGIDVSKVRKACAGFEGRGYMNQTQMNDAIDNLGLMGLATPKVKAPRQGHNFPNYGVALIQWRGKWDSAPPIAQYPHTHWIGVNGKMIFDVNQDPHWQGFVAWSQATVKRITDTIKDADGRWYLRMGIEIDQ